MPPEPARVETESSEATAFGKLNRIRAERGIVLGQVNKPVMQLLVITAV